MGCKKIDDETKFNRIIHDPMFIGQKKLDGVRAVMQFDERGLSRFTTRGASVSDPTKPIDITNRVRHLLTKIPQGSKWETLILDGELYSPNLTAAQVAGMINPRSSTPVDTSIRFNVFDILSYLHRDLTPLSWVERMQEFKEVKMLLQNRPDKFVFLDWVDTPEEKMNLFLTEINEGREGIVLKNIRASYQVGDKKELKPSHVWYKMKCEDNLDGVIIGADPPEEFYSDPTTGKKDYNRHTKFWENGWIGALLFRFEDKDGNTHMGKCSGMTDAVRAMFSSHGGLNQEYMGRTIEVKYMQKTDDGNLRSPRFVRLREEVEK
jgi:ATP-dependent DNA ligase